MVKKKNSGEEIIKLNDFSHARLRTEMYLGSRTPHTQEVVLYSDDLKPYIKEVTWVPALFTAFREILDNAADEVIGHRQGNSIWVEFDEKEFVFSVEDNGRGIPITINEEEQIHMATMALTQARAGRNFEERGEVSGTNGLGAACTNFCSEWFELQIIRDGKKFVQKFTEGSDSLNISTPKITPSASKTTGTKIRFKPSKHVFETVPKLQNNLILPEEFVRSRIVELAICNPQVKVFYNGQRITVKQKPEQTLFQGKDVITIDIKETGFVSKFFIIPNWEVDGEFNHSIVNNIPAFNGGTHVENFRRTFYKTLLSNLERESKRRKLTPNNTDVQQNLLIFNITTMQAPNFDSQSKTRLINEHAGSYVKKFLESDDFYKGILKKNKEWIDQIYARCSDRTNKKDADEINKLNKKITKAKVPKLLDANSKNRKECVLFLTEGDSAAASIKSVRNPDIHASLPLRGKVMNVRGMNPKDVLANKELADIMNVIGLSIGQKADLKNLRYGKLYIAHDADEDGKNIGALLINFLYSFWPELFQGSEPFVYIFDTPFIIAYKGKDRKYWYAKNYEDFKAEDWKGYSITRAKGLGSLQREDWEISIKQPEVISIMDDGLLEETLDLIFNQTRADDRKEWMANE